MKFLVIDTVNYIDYPTGGVMAYYRTMLPPCGNDLILVGISTDDVTPIGKWSKRVIEGIEYDYYTLNREVPSSRRPLIPGRFRASFLVWKNIKRVIATAPRFDYIITQSHEVLSHIPNHWMSKTCFISPGVGNPLSISRYPWARKFAKIYDKYYFMPKVAKVRWILAAADRKSIEDFAKRSGGRMKADEIIPFPTRYNDQYFKILPTNECRQKLGIAENVKMFVTVGRLNWFKGWKLMIDAFALLPLENKELYFIGDGEDEKKIRAYADLMGISSKVFLIGKKKPTEISLFLNASDIFIMGSFMEGWSTTLVEACACGVPCVVTEFSSSKEMVSDGDNGFVVPERSPEDFAARMMDCLKLERRKVQDYDKRFQYLAQSRIKEELYKIIKTR